MRLELSLLHVERVQSETGVSIHFVHNLPEEQIHDAGCLVEILAQVEEVFALNQK